MKDLHIETSWKNYLAEIVIASWVDNVATIIRKTNCINVRLHQKKGLIRFCTYKILKRISEPYRG